jgi:phosphoglycolate phosphatase
MAAYPYNRLLLAWDIDGTLVQAKVKNSASTTFARATSSVLGRPVSAEFVMAGMTDLEIVLRVLSEAGASRKQAPAVLDALDASSATGQGEYEVIPAPGALTALSRAHASGIENVLLTGNTPTRARQKLLSAGYDETLFDWDLSAFGRHTPHRADLAQAVASAADALSLIPVIIGDTPLDAQAAAQAGVLFCGVATGRFSTSELSTHSPDIVLEDLHVGLLEFEKFLSLLSVRHDPLRTE